MANNDSGFVSPRANNNMKSPLGAAGAQMHKLGSGKLNGMRSQSTNAAEENFLNHGGARRVNDGTSDKELQKAMITYLNKTGAGDYEMPKLIGDKLHTANMRNQPNWSMQSRTKLAWFPGRNVDFQASSSPAATVYSPQHDRPFRNQQFSVGKQGRFDIPTSVTKVQQKVPHQYQTLDPGLVTGNQKNYGFNQVAMGYGHKTDFTHSKQLTQFPGAKYEQHNINSIAYRSIKQNPKTQYGFYNKYDKHERTCFKGMEQHFYGREGKGPGAYLKTDFVHLSPTKKASQFSVPKSDRGLLTQTNLRKVSPGPSNYEAETQAIKARVKDATFAMPKASRDVSFSKYSAQHSHLIKKGLF